MVVSIWITDNCNMMCDYCYEGKKNSKNMPFNYIVNIIAFINQQLPLSGTNQLYIKFFGGEPLLNFSFIKKFVETLDSEDLGIPILYSITTNGTLLSEDTIQFMIKNDFDCSISIDGLPDIHNAHRKMKSGEGSWEYIQQNIEPLITQYAQKLFARVTYTPATVSFLLESIVFLTQVGFKRIIAVPDYFSLEWNKESFEELSLQYGEIKKFQKKNQDIEISLGIRRENLFKEYIGCGGGKSTFSISVDGGIFPCTYAVEFPELKLGDIFHLEKYKIPDFSVNAENRKSCMGCKYFRVCLSGRCIFLNYKITGNYYEPGGFFCQYQQLEYKHYGI